jgi:hypothetical protein
VNLRSVLAGRVVYVAWTALSAAALAVAKASDPYLFGLAAFIAAVLSGILALGALAFAYRRLPWAVLAALPTVVSFAILQTYKWN